MAEEASDKCLQNPASINGVARRPFFYPSSNPSFLAGFEWTMMDIAPACRCLAADGKLSQARSGQRT
jgi:hypothetical protein